MRKLGSCHAKVCPSWSAEEALVGAAMATLPCALLTSCASGFIEEDLVTQIIGKEQIPAPQSVTEGVRQYAWRIDNKYYTADVNICVVPGTSHVTTQIAKTAQAFLVYFDSTQKSGLEKVSAWLPLLEDWLLDVMILVCDRVSESGVTRQTAQEWCIQHGFELVELNPEELPDEDDDFPESTGVTRIVQALNATVWSNVEMKSEQAFGIFSSLGGMNHSTETSDDQQGEVLASCQLAAEQSERGTSHSPSETQVDSIVDPMLDLDIQELASLTSSDGDLENFSRLFSKLQAMKEKAASLPHEQRKLHAEKVAKAFWMAIGGDRDEIEGLSSEEEN
ncbi:alpha- and gamma-adaptin-binding protein p34 [Bombina bombina]|uniref:alpha- and gamma-adaptin-binding protein p34 n=1 Tax=Bombina bombina TaxID=8345 RepID=UPI00235A9FD0|nr:alpha- and gamma-adaptin-binding protein p34 [Bombina bombina]